VDDSKVVAGEPDMGCIQMNLSKAPFNNAKLRQAMAYATSSEQYVQVIDGGVTEPTNGVFTAGSPYYLTDNGYPAYNLAKAKQLVSEVKSSGGRWPSRWPHPGPKAARSASTSSRCCSRRHAGDPGADPPGLDHQRGADRCLRGADVAAVRAVNPTSTTSSGPPPTRPPPVRHQHGRNTDPAMQTALLQGVSRRQGDAGRRLPAGERLLSQDIPYVWYARTVWAIGTQPNVQNFNNPSTPAGGKAFGLIGGRSGPSRSGCRRRRLPQPHRSLDDRPARSGRGGRVMIGP